MSATSLPPGDVESGLGRSLPVADRATVRRKVLDLARRRRRMLAAVLVWFALAAACDLAVPALIGRLVEQVEQRTTMSAVNLNVALITAFLVAQFALGRTALVASARLGEFTLADLREDFVDHTLGLPLEMVERAGSGDLLTRSTRDVDTLSGAIRSGAPSILSAGLTIVFTLVALAVTSLLMLLAALVAVPPVVTATRWYLHRARAAYLRQAASYSDLTGALNETVTGARTVDALRLGPRRVHQVDELCARSFRAERATLFLRTVWFPVLDLGYSLPTVGVVIAGAFAYTSGWVGLAGVVAGVLYTRALVRPLDDLLFWLDELQSAGASLARVIGVELAPGETTGTGTAPADGRLRAKGVSYAYRPGVNVVHEVDLDVIPGERLAVVGATGAGKSTLGRLLAGIHRPGRGEVSLGGVRLTDLPLAERRRHVALVTQEHHIFTGTIGNNVALAKTWAADDEVLAALDAVDAGDWVRRLPSGLDTRVGDGGQSLSPARAQQIALARLVLADPHTLILDEATSLIDPRAARHLERSLSAVVQGRTVVAVAHRLHTAEDADRVAVMAQGQLVEIGTHDELVARGGTYARLWASWHGASPTPREERVDVPDIDD